MPEIESEADPGTMPTDEAQGLLDSLAAVSSSWEALKTAAPDCDLDG